MAFIDATSVFSMICYGPCAPVYFGNVFAVEHEFHGVENVQELRRALVRAIEGHPRYTLKPSPFEVDAAAAEPLPAAAAAAAAAAAVSTKAASEGAGGGRGCGSSTVVATSDVVPINDDEVVVSAQPGGVAAAAATANESPFKRTSTVTKLRMEDAFVGGVIRAPELALFGRYRTKMHGFTDDLAFTFVVRDGARVTMRAVSASRNGISDFGQNYRNVRVLLDAIRKDSGFRSKQARFQPYMAYASKCPCSCTCFCCCTACSR